MWPMANTICEFDALGGRRELEGVRIEDAACSFLARKSKSGA